MSSLLKNVNRFAALTALLFAAKHKGSELTPKFAGRPPRSVNFVLLNWAMNAQL
jgi:hypothetical protein